VVAVPVESYTAAVGAAGGRCSSWLGRGGDKVVAAAVQLVATADGATSGRCSSWLGPGRCDVVSSLQLAAAAIRSFG